MFNYAQVDSNGICIGISQTQNKINSTKVIEVENYDSLLVGRRYNNGIWEEVETPPIIQPVTQQDKIEAGIDYLVMLSQ